MAHATAEDYEEYTGASAPANIGLLLARASRLIDSALISAVYTTDSDGMATDPRVLAALRDATVEQAAAWATGGEDGTGATPQYTSVSIGSVNLAGRTSPAPAAGPAGLAPQALLVLRTAGLTEQRVWVC